jgi:metal-responsive CopG/Arc/MetJ family transcriptional regulator
MSDEQKTERVQLMMTPSEVKAVDDWSFENRVRGRSEAIRRLIQLGLDKSIAPTKRRAGPVRKSTE